MFILICLNVISQVVLYSMHKSCFLFFMHVCIFHFNSNLFGNEPDRIVSNESPKNVIKSSSWKKFFVFIIFFIFVIYKLFVFKMSTLCHFLIRLISSPDQLLPKQSTNKDLLKSLTRRFRAYNLSNWCLRLSANLTGWTDFLILNIQQKISHKKTCLVFSFLHFFVSCSM